ncbi:MAG: MMPL family transporter, partial [Mycobacterium sp.]
MREVSARPETTGTAGGGGIFGQLGRFVVRWPWIVVGCWAALAVALPLTFPSLTEMAQQRPVAILPADAPVTVTNRQMTDAFQESGSENVLLVVLTNEAGLGPADQAGYRTLVDALRRDTRDVVMLQDFVSTPALREVMTSADGKAWILPVGIAGEVGSPQSYFAFTRVADSIDHAVDGTTLTAQLTGPAATVADLTDVGERDRFPIELATAIMLLTILLIIYRNPV